MRSARPGHVGRRRGRGQGGAWGLLRGGQGGSGTGGIHPSPVGARYSIASCDLRVFMDQPTKSILSHNPSDRQDDRWFDGPEWWCLPQGVVRPVAVVMIDVFGQHSPQLPASACVPIQRPKPWACRCGDLRFRSTRWRLLVPAKDRLFPMPCGPSTDRSPGQSSGHRVTARPTASRISPASISTRYSAISRAGHSHTKANGPAGGSGHTQCSISQAEPPPPPPCWFSTGGSGAWPSGS